MEVMKAPWRGMRDHVADNKNCGPAADPRGQIRQFVERADSGLRIAQRHPREYADRRLRRAPGSEQTAQTDGAAVIPI